MPSIRSGVAMVGRRLRGDQEAGYHLANWVTGWLAPAVIMPEPARRWMVEASFIDQYRSMTGGALMEQADKKLTLRNLAAWVAGVDGAVAECGTFRGVSTRFIADAMPGKALLLFDSFEGLSEPSVDDGTHWQSNVLAATEDDVRRNLGPHLERATFYPGWIPERFGEVADESFALVHIDVDLYEPHRDSIAFFWPRVNPGGIIVFDDYGSEYCPGARKAVDEAFSPSEIVELPTGQSFVVKR